MLDNRVKVLLRSDRNLQDSRILDLKGIVGIIDMTPKSDSISWVRIDEPGGSFAHDLSLRLKKKEIMNYPEVFVFKDEMCADFVFRAVAKTIDFRAPENDDVAFGNE